MTSAKMNSGSAVELLSDVSADEPPTAEEQLAQFFGEGHAEQDVTCSIYELAGPNWKERSFLFSFPFEDGLSAPQLFEDLLARAGPGRYELHAQKRNGQMVTRKVFQVGSTRLRKRPSLVPSDEAEARPESAPASTSKPSPAPASSLPPEIAQLLISVTETQTKILERLEEQGSQPRGGSFDAVRDLLELKKLFEPQQTPVGEIFGIVKDVLALKEEIAGDSGEQSGIGSAMKQLTPLLAKYLDQSGAQAPRTESAPASAATSQAEAPPASATGPLAMLNLDKLFAELRTMAENNIEPPAAAFAVFDWLADQPGWIEQAVFGLIADERERVVGRLVGAHPKLTAHREWLTAVVKVLVAELDAPDAESGAVDPPPAAEGKEGKESAEAAPADARTS